MYFEKFIDSIVEQTQDKIERIVKEYENSEGVKDMHGEMGESFVGRGLKHALLRLGFKHHTFGGKGTFQIVRYLGAKSKKRGEGIDFGLLIVDSKGLDIEFQIEVKNWKDYGWETDEEKYESDKYIVEESYKKIINRFNDYDSSSTRQIRIVTMNKGNIQRLKPYCDRDKIYIIELADKLTEENATPEFIEHLFRQFIGQFTELLVGYLREGMPMAEAHFDAFNSVEEEIKFFMELGVPTDILMRKYKKDSKEYMRKLKAEVIKETGVKLVDARTKMGRMLRDL